MKKYSKKIFTAVMFVLLGLTLVACKKTVNELPTLSGVGNTSTPYGVPFDPKAGVTAYDKEDGNLTDKIVVTGTVDHNVAKAYTLNYSVKDSGGQEAKATRIVTVLGETETPLAQGWFNYKFASPDTRHTFFAAAEGWLLENAYAGIPLAAQTGLTMQHDRVVLPVEDYIPSFGWGTNYSTITMDDAQVAENNGGDLDLLNTPAVEGKYTYRKWTGQEPETLNYYTGQSTTDSDFNSYLNGSFYSTALNNTANGWEFVPELASGEPIPVNATVVNGKTIARKWEIPLRDGLKWAYNAGTDTSKFPAGHDKLTAHDFEYSYRLALDNEWFRATQGGGDFISQKVKGAEAYAEAVAKNANKSTLDNLWKDFGIHATEDGKKIVVEFTEAKSMFDIKYGFGAPAVNKAVYEANPDLYGTSSKHIASSGLYTISYWEDGVGSRYEKVATHPLAKTISWDAESIKILTGTSSQDAAFTAFENGLLDSVGVPNSQVGDYGDDPRVLRSPGASIWSLNINMMGTVQAQQAQWPGSTYVPEPILGNKDFRLALYFSLNRDEMPQYDPKTYPTGMKVSQAYYVDPEGGIPYRSTPQGMAVGNNLAYQTNGYDPEAAQALFKRAVEAEIAAGNYKKGTAANPTIIELEVLTFDEASGSAVSDNWMAFSQAGFETLIDNENHVHVKMKSVRTPGSKIYDLIEEGSYDLALSSISGNTLDAASFLDTFISDNRTGFLLNYGYDSSVAEIEVEWTEEGVHQKAIFSFDAIYEILNGKTFIKDGNKITEYGNVDQIIDIYLEEKGLTGGERDAQAGNTLVQVYGAGALADLEKGNVDEVLGVVVNVTEGDKTVKYLFVITKTGNVYELYGVNVVDYETSEKDLLDKILGDNPGTKTTVNADDVLALAEWYEFDVDLYDEIIAYYYDNEDGRKIVILGKAGDLYLLVTDEEVLVNNLANAKAVIEGTLGKTVYNVREVVDATALNTFLKGKHNLDDLADLAENGFGVNPDFLVAYEFDINETGDQNADGRVYVALFIVAGNIVDSYYL